MDLDPTEGEPRRTEDLARSGRAGGGGASGSDWPRWTLFAVSTVFAGLALWTGWAWLTFFSAGALLAGLTVNAWSPGGVGPRLSLLTLRSWWARWSWRAILAVEAWQPPWSREARHSRRSISPRRPRRSSGTWSANDTSGVARRRARRGDDPRDDRRREGQDR